MNLKIVIAGLVAVILGAYAHGATLTGTCDNVSTQCDLSLRELELCNNSASTETYSSYFSGNTSSWFNVLPGRVTLGPDECEQLRVYTVANCYADPGIYSAELIVQNTETIRATCLLEVKQGHFVGIDVRPAVQEATQCEEKTYEIVVSNNTIVPNQSIERVDLSISGIPNDWYTLEEQRVLVKKGEPQTVKMHVQAPCDTDFGSYEFTARATLVNPNFYSEDNAQYVLRQGQGSQLILGAGFDAGKISACLETPGEAKIRVVNNGKLADNYKITLEGPEFAKLDRTSIALDPGKEQEVTLKLNETNMQPANYEFGLNLQSTLFDYSASKPFTVNLQDCYNLQVEKLGGNENVCVEDTPVYKFSLKNNRTKTVDLDVSVLGIGAQLDNPKISIGPGETKTIEARLDVSNLAEKAKAVKKTDLAVELLMDTSGSMIEQNMGKTKIDAAKTAIINLVNKINEVDLGMRVFGQGALCEDSQLLVPVKNLDIPAITDRVSAFKPAGKTPLTQALGASIADFPAGKQKAIILVSDGRETCEGNITETAKELAQNRITVYSIGFDIDADGQKQLQEISRTTNGKYFDARNSEELSEVLQKISQELDIIPSGIGRKTFTVRLDSPNFSYEKDFSLVVSDCYNAALVAPELNLCLGVDKNESIKLANIGSEKQAFNLSYSPDWINGPASIEVEPNTDATVPFTARTPNAKAEETYSVKAVSGRLVQFNEEKNINYLSNAGCFGIDLIILEPVLDAATCEGQKQTLIIENRGVITQNVKLSADKPFVFMVEAEVNVEPGEREEVNFFVSPPFDLPRTTFITINAETDRGFKTSAQLKLEVSGNEESFGLGEVDLRVQDLNFTEVEGLEHNIEVNFEIYNDSNRTLEVFNATTLDFNGVVQLENRFIQAKETVKARILVKIPEEMRGKTVTVPFSLETDEGTYTRNAAFQYAGATAETPGTDQNVVIEEPVSVGTGLFSLATISTAILGFLVLLVIGLIIMSAYNASKHEAEKEQPGNGNGKQSIYETRAAEPEEETPKKKKPAKKKASRKK